MADTRILLLGNATSDPLAKVLGRPGRALTRIEDPAQLAAAALEHDVIVLDVVPRPRTLVEVCREIRAVPELADVPILVISSSRRGRGADPPARGRRRRRHGPADRRARARRPGRGPRPAPPPVQGAAPEHAGGTTTRRPGRRLIAVFSPKGGVGTTTVERQPRAGHRRPRCRTRWRSSTSRRWAATSRRTSTSDPKLTIADLIRDSQGTDQPGDPAGHLPDAPRARRARPRRRAQRRRRTPLMSGPETTRILEAVLAAVPTVVVDLGSHLDERVVAALDMADDMVDRGHARTSRRSRSVHAFFEYLGERRGPEAPSRRSSSTRPTRSRRSRRPTSRTRSGGGSRSGSRTTRSSTCGPRTRARRSSPARPRRSRRAATTSSRRSSSARTRPGASHEPRRRGLAGIFGRS